MNILLKHKKKCITEETGRDNSSSLPLQNYHNPVPELSPIIPCIQNVRSLFSKQYFLSNPYLEHKIVLNKKLNPFKQIKTL